MVTEIFGIVYTAVVVIALGYFSYSASFSPEARETWKRIEECEERHNKK